MVRWTLAALAAWLTAIGWSHAQDYSPLLPPPQPLLGGPAAEHPPVPAPADAAVAADPAERLAGHDAAPGEACSCWACDCCKPRLHFRASAEYLFWWLKSSPIAVPLVTLGSPLDPVPGALGQPGTRVLFGNETVNGNDPYSGFRGRIGVYSDRMMLGLDLGGFFTESQTTSFGDGSSPLGSPVIGRPFFSTAANLQAVNVIGLPGAVTGTVEASLETQLWGTEANFVRPVCCGPLRMLYVGFRHVGLREELGIFDNTRLLDGGVAFFDGLPIAPGDIRRKDDRFQTENNFYGGQIGGQATWDVGRFNINLRTMVAFGTMRQVLNIDGLTELRTTTGAVAALPAGLLAVGSNSGHHVRDDFAVVPEVDLSIGVLLAPWARLSVGYNFLYLSRVARPGDQIDPNIDPVQIPISPNYNPALRPLQPTVPFTHTDFWAQGLNFGLCLSF